MILTTIAFDTYWRFAAERLAIFYRRCNDPVGPWTTDPILSVYRFTNVYRATDRVSQYLIREIQYREDRSQNPEEIFFRTLLFKIFNKIETWDALESMHGPLTWKKIDLNALDQTLTKISKQGQSIYSAAYIIPAPAMGKDRKHSNHLRLVEKMMKDRLPTQILKAKSLEAVYKSILAYPGLGPFLAFQYAIDLNYSAMLNFDESEFVVAGPGALDGISKCFRSLNGYSPESIIRWMADRQVKEFSERGLIFPGLFGRPLQLIDCQNIFCEVSKYTRVAHPELTGVAKRKRIKQIYKSDKTNIGDLVFPPRWGLDSKLNKLNKSAPTYKQLSLI